LPGAGAPPTAACFASRVEFVKDEVFDICSALALGEAALIGLGLDEEAAQLGAIFDVVEGRLTAVL
jgi:hypothetical protein